LLKEGNWATTGVALVTSSTLFSPSFEFPVEPWVLATLVATLFQTARFAVQKRLTLSGLSALAATWARFLWATPVLILVLIAWLSVTNAELPALSGAFWAFVLIGSVAQILATVCVLLLFKVRAFAVGLTFKKSEALQTGLLGWLVLGDPLSIGGAAALLVGFIALVILSFPSGGNLSHASLKTVVLGLASGAFFAVTGVAFRAAVLEIDASTQTQAALALIVSTTVQTLLLAVWPVRSSHRNDRFRCW
jgi:drug/metabolite transporter (DMT)-like permease